jgi:hypothetical protein
MTNSPKEARRRKSAPRLWTYAQAKAAIPYISSVLRSLREHSLEAQAQQVLLDRLTTLAGRPNRDTLIAQEEARRAMARASEERDSAARELAALDIVPLDEVGGTALLPFVYEDQLAWFVFDLFDGSHLRFWRYQSDPDTTRRRLTAAQTR